MKKTLLVMVFLLFIFWPINRALSSVTDDISEQIKEKQDSIKTLQDKINVYQKDIESKQKEAVNLSNQLAILKSKISKAGLDIRLTETQIESLDLEINSLGQNITEKKEKIEKQKHYIQNLLRQININDQRDYLNVILSRPSFSEYFNQLKYLEDINSQITQVLKIIKTEKKDLEDKQNFTEAKKQQVQKLNKQLLDHNASLNNQKEANSYLLNQTKLSESKFKSLLAQLKREQSSFDQEIINLQNKLKKELNKDSKLDTNPSVLSWPADPVKGISTYFRDSTYPFKYLFEHTGIDLPIKTGTALRAAASGYVAWVRNNSKSYGNNIMIIHNNGIATLYGHLSRFNASEGSYVARGDIIGYSGGMPGTPGAGFSTGPHLHFEVRVNGLPVDPMDY